MGPGPRSFTAVTHTGPTGWRELYSNTHTTLWVHPLSNSPNNTLGGLRTLTSRALQFASPQFFYVLHQPYVAPVGYKRRRQNWVLQGVCGTSGGTVQARAAGLPTAVAAGRAHVAGMIRYERTEWYGFFYLFRLAGSTLPRCLPAMLLAAAISAFFSSGVIDRAGVPIRDFFGHPYAMQVLGLVFGYLSINRLNVSYNRYWEGISHVKVMHSKWMSACVQLLAYDRVSTSDRSVGAHNADGTEPQLPITCAQADPFCQHLVRLFMQVSAVSILKLVRHRRRTSSVRLVA